MSSHEGLRATVVPLGRLLIAREALAVLSHDDVLVALGRHVRRDWGELDCEDKAANDRALVDHSRLLSSYRAKEGRKFWIITEADRSATTVLLPEEY
ncbi:MAG: hypothetical protein ACKVXR_16865 [Planctomycetota bacterium]